MITLKYMKKKIFFLSILISKIIFSSNLLEKANEHKKQEQFSKAITCYQQVITQQPHDTAAYFGLGCSFLNIGKFDEAIDAFQHIIKRSPHASSVRYNIAYTLKTAGRLDEAIDLYKKIITDNPTYDPAQLALGFAYLTQGDFAHGWKQHERYLKQSGKNGDALRTLLHTNNIAGKTILLRPEGGLGDTLMFIRYAQHLKNLGATIIAHVQRPLIPLLSRCSYIDIVLPTRAASNSLFYDARATLMSLPAIFYDDEQTIPRDIPYIYPDPALVNFWKQKIAKDNNVKIGICWQADVHNDSSRLPIARRGIPLAKFFQLKNISGIAFYSLQKYTGVEQLGNLPKDFPLHFFQNDFDESHGSFMDTAAIMQHMDVIITVDTAIAHLAGALGRPVWLLLPYATDWRWIHNRTDSPWYPTMHIFKQPAPFDWDSVIEQVHEKLQAIEQ